MLASLKKIASVVKTFGARDILTATIAKDAAVSGVIEIGGARHFAIQMPAAWTTANLTFQASNLIDGTFYDVYGSDGIEIMLTATASRMIVLDIHQSALAPLSFIKIRSGTTGTPVNQAAARTLNVILKG